MRPTVGEKYFLEQNCSPIGADGKFLCDLAKDRGLREEGPFRIDVDEALEAASGKTAEPLSVDGTSGLSDTMALARGSSSPELFPLILGSVLIVFLMALTAAAIATMSRQWRKDGQGSEAGDESEPGGVRIEEQETEAADVDNTWINDQHLALHQDSELGVGTDNGEVNEEKKAVLSWKDLSCKYPSKKSDGGHITTLSGVTGKIYHEELVAIMVSLNKESTTRACIQS